MTITPQDIQAKQFHVRMRGFDMDEVDKFLEKVAEEFLIVTLENKQLHEKVETMEKELANYRNKEQAFQSAIVSAQRISDEMQAKSRREAEEIVANAKQSAEELSEQVHREAEELTEKSRQEAEELRSNAEAEAQRILENSQEEHLELTASINRLIEIKDRIQADLRQMLTNYMERINESIPTGLNALEPLRLPVIEVDSPPAPDEDVIAEFEIPVPDLENFAEQDLEDLYEKIDLPDIPEEADFAENFDEEPPATLNFDDIEPVETDEDDLAKLEELNEEEEELLFSLDDPLEELEPSITINEDDKTD